MYPIWGWIWHSQVSSANNRGKNSKVNFYRYCQRSEAIVSDTYGAERHQ